MLDWRCLAYLKAWFHVDLQLTARLRCAREYSTIYARTNRYKNSLIVYGLNHWQFQ